jgi:hypothetical protein
MCMKDVKKGNIYQMKNEPEVKTPSNSLALNDGKQI